ncbi:MAG: efflux RND transporter permease subunit [Deltaproteobacteria bacterium]|nr:efflux RND transporter permease subunit [Deltaproteobacteria bacterium]
MSKIQEHAGLSLILVGLVAVYGFYAKEHASVDAIPDIGQNQVIVITNWQGQSPKDVEDQITYPLSVALLAVPGAESVRGKSLFGFSFVQVTFSDNTDYYWARSRVSEQLPTVAANLPEGASPVLGPDATGLGQIFYYVLEPSKPDNPAHLRSVQDYVIKYALQSVEGVSEVASIGGFIREYQVDLDPDQLHFHKVPIETVSRALRASNKEVGAKTIEQSDMEFIIRGKGFLGGRQGPEQTVIDLENTVVSSKEGIPLRIKDIAEVRNGTAFRRGALDFDGTEAVGGIVVMRLGENPGSVIERVKQKISQLEPSLDGIKIKAVYDRTTLIDETVRTLSDALLHEILITILVIVLFLMHIKTSLVVASVLPLSVYVSFIIMRHAGLDMNIMSLAGIAIAIGNMVDIGIVIAESIYSRISAEKDLPLPERIKAITEASAEVVPPLLTATATTVISFLPVFFLTGRDYKLFAPLALTKTCALLSALAVSLIVVPLFSRFLIREQLSSFARRSLPFVTALFGSVLSSTIAKSSWSDDLWIGIATAAGALPGYITGRLMAKEKLLRPEDSLMTQFIYRIYEPMLRWAIHHKWLCASLPFLIFGAGLASWSTLKTDDWIALDEGSFFYMPTMYPGISFSKAYEILQTQDTLIKKIPEVKHVLGKIGRADSALDPAPTAMIETYIMLKEKSRWREGVTEKEIWQEINSLATLPGVTPASLLQPIEGRVVMLQSGIKASMAVRIYGDSLDGLAIAARQVAEHLKTMDVVNKTTINPDLVLGKPYVEFNVDRTAAARYGMSVGAVNELIATALGGTTIGKTVEGRERYPIRLRYHRQYRDDLESLERLPVITAKGETVPLKALANMETLWGPAGISSENARLVAHVSFAPAANIGAIATADAVMASLQKAQTEGALSLPPGYEMEAVGSFQNQAEANRTLMWVVPLVILLNLLIIFLTFGRWSLSLLIFSGIPLASGGGMLLLFLTGTQINTAVWIGFIALFGIAVDNGVILSSYLEARFASHPPRSRQDIIDNVIHAGLRRIRPCLMTTATTIIALLPVLLSDGKGAEVAKGMALPIFGGMFSALLILLVLPALYARLMERKIHTPYHKQSV